MDKLIKYCEKLHKEWISDQLIVSEKTNKEFQMDYMPEPYLDFSKKDNPLYILTTNPGAGMLEQYRKNIIIEDSIITKNDSYQDTSKTFANFYVNNLTGAAKRRIDGFKSLANNSGFDGFIQIESYPFHSRNLPNKTKFLKEFKEDNIFVEYSQLLKNTQKDKNVIVLSAVGTKSEISNQSISSNEWLQWQANLMGLNTSNLKKKELLLKDGKVTSMFLYEKDNNLTKGFILMMGGNHLPNEDVLNLIVEVLKS